MAESKSSLVFVDQTTAADLARVGVLLSGAPRSGTYLLEDAHMRHVAAQSQRQRRFVRRSSAWPGESRESSPGVGDEVSVSSTGRPAIVDTHPDGTGIPISARTAVRPALPLPAILQQLLHPSGRKIRRRRGRTARRLADLPLPPLPPRRLGPTLIEHRSQTSPTRP